MARFMFSNMRPGADVDPLEADGLHQEGPRVELADRRPGRRSGRCGRRARTALIERGRVPAPPTSTTWSTPRPSVRFPGGDVPVGRGLVVDPVGRAQVAGPGQLGVAAGRGDHPGPGEPGELEGEKRDAAGPLDQDRLARPQAAPLRTGHARPSRRRRGGSRPPRRSGGRGRPDDAPFGQDDVARPASRRPPRPSPTSPPRRSAGRRPRRA